MPPRWVVVTVDGGCGGGAGVDVICVLRCLSKTYRDSTKSYLSGLWTERGVLIIVSGMGPVFNQFIDVLGMAIFPIWKIKWNNFGSSERKFPIWFNVIAF